MRKPKHMTYEQASRWAKPETIAACRVAVYTMIGGGMLGQSAANDPWTFYIDTRVGKLPYSKRDIMHAVRDLATLCDAAGLTSVTMPPMPNFPNLGVF